MIGSDIFFVSRIKHLAALTVRHAVPSIFQYREFAAAGGLMSYGGNLTDLYREVGIYACRISQRESGPTCRSSSPRKSSLPSISRPPRRSVSLCRRPYSPAPTRSSSETPPLHHGARRRGGVAAQGERAAAGGNTGDRVPQRWTPDGSAATRPRSARA